MTKAMTEQRDDYDSPWKDILQVYFREFLAFFFPQVEADINWDRDYEFLDKEFQQVVRDAELGRRYADKLVKVWRKNGEETWILVHIEVQGWQETEFAERIYVYNYRIFDRYRRPVASLAVLADDRPGWRPDQFGYKIWGCEVNLRFPVVKLLDYGKEWARLKEEESPFAVIVMAHLKATETRNNPDMRKERKLDLIKVLYRTGYTRQDVIRLFGFIDWIMNLPEELSESLWDELSSYEEEKKMRYVTSVEKIGIEKGMQQGMQQGMRQTACEVLIETLETRFDVIPRSLMDIINGVNDPALLKMLHKKAITATSLDKFKETMEAMLK